VTRCPRLAGGSCEIQAPALAASRGLARLLAAERARAGDLGQAEQVGHHGLAAAIFVGAIGMQSVAAAAGFQIDQRHRQVVAPRNHAKARVRPRLSIRHRRPRATPQAGRNRRGGLQRLLIEGARRLAPFAEALRADRPERPAGVVCSVISQRSDRNPAST
jgi:hypothetical protein